jgi:hypothetical protein
MAMKGEVGSRRPRLERPVAVPARVGGRGPGPGRTLGSIRPVPDRPAGPPPESAAPPPAARIAAFAAIVLAGVCGGLIGYAVTDRGCDGGCQTAAGGVGLVAAIGAAIGVAVVAVLVLRAMGEWNATPEHVRRTRGR